MNSSFFKFKPKGDITVSRFEKELESISNGADALALEKEAGLAYSYLVRKLQNPYILKGERREFEGYASRLRTVYEKAAQKRYNFFLTSL